MTTPIVAGLGVAAVAYSGRAAILAFEAWKKAPPRMRRFYDGGFEPEMTRRRRRSSSASARAQPRTR